MGRTSASMKQQWAQWKTSGKAAGILAAFQTPEARAKRNKSLSALYAEHPERKTHLITNGYRLARSEKHHRRKPGEYFLPAVSRAKISSTLRRLYKQEPASWAAALEGLRKGREQMRRFGVRTKPERAMRTLLSGAGIRFAQEAYLAPYWIDFVLPDSKVALLVDGCFWHACQIHCPGPLTKAQAQNLSVDRSRDKSLLRGGWTIIHVWEHELVPVRRRHAHTDC